MNLQFFLDLRIDFRMPKNIEQRASDAIHRYSNALNRFLARERDAVGACVAYISQ